MAIVGCLSTIGLVVSVWLLRWRGQLMSICSLDPFRGGAALLGARLRVTDFVVPIAVSGSRSCRLEASATVPIGIGLQPAALARADWRAARQRGC